MGAIDSLGKQWHRNVDHYQSGGMGHLEGDQTHSVVGFMPTKEMLRYREHNGLWGGHDSGAEEDERRVQKIQHDIESGVGIHSPLTVHYWNGWGYVGEGNHRLEAARRAGAPVVPVRVVRGGAYVERAKEQGVGGPMHSQTVFDSRNPEYTPTDMHPAHFLRGGPERYQR